MVPDYQTSSLHRDVLQALDGVFVPPSQVIVPQCSRVPAEEVFLSKINQENQPDSFLNAINTAGYEEKNIREID